MHRTVLVRQVAPAVLLFAALFAAAVGLDAFLHRAGWSGVGLWLGFAGTALIVLSFLYSLRKRNLIASGRPRALLDLHQVFGWSGALLVMVHAGIHVRALLPWAAMAAMLIVVASGITGGILLRQAVSTLRDRQATAAPDDARLVLDAATVDVMKKWRRVHMPLNAVFVVLTLAHIAAALLLRSWWAR